MKNEFDLDKRFEVKYIQKKNTFSFKDFYFDLRIKKVYETVTVNNIYSDMKVSQENEIKKLSKVGNFNYCILRLFQIYGKNISTNIIYRFIKMKKNNLKITINGDGKQIRDQLHVKDLVRAIYKISINIRTIF